MHKCLLLVLFLPLSLFAAGTKDGWTRIQSDDREFSIEIPDTFVLFRDDDGFTISKPNYDYAMKKMVLVSAVVNGTLVSVESYEVGKAALDSIYEGDQRFRTKLHKSSEKRDNFTIRVLTDEMQSAFLKKEYFYSKKRIYILTAGARTGETPEMKRFFDSLKFTPGTAQDVDLEAKGFSQISAEKVDIETNVPPPPPPPAMAPKKPDLKPEEKLVILTKPLPTFTNAARSNLTNGTMVLRVTFEPTGLISKIGLRGILGEGLARQAVFAAIRIRYLPPASGPDAMKAVTKQVEYSFSIY